MRWMMQIAVAMLVWGSSALADYPPAGDVPTPDLDRISSWMAYFKQQDPDLKLRLLVNPDDNRATAERVLADLEELDHALIQIRNGHTGPAPGSLKTLACLRPMCAHRSAENQADKPIQIACPQAACAGD